MIQVACPKGSEESSNHYSSQVMSVTHQKTFPIIPTDSTKEQKTNMEIEPIPDDPKDIQTAETAVHQQPLALDKKENTIKQDPPSNANCGTETSVASTKSEAVFDATTAGAATASEIFRHLQVGM